MPRYRRQQPEIVNPGGVKLGIGPRPMGMTTDETRAQAADGSGGEPLVDFDGTSNPCNDDQSIDRLLSLQHPRSDAYDEHGFYLMGQVKAAVQGAALRALQRAAAHQAG